MMTSFFVFTGVTFWVCAAVWAADEMWRRLRTRRWDRHIDQAIAATQTAPEDRDDWGTR